MNSLTISKVLIVGIQVVMLFVMFFFTHALGLSLALVLLIGFQLMCILKSEKAHMIYVFGGMSIVGELFFILGQDCIPSNSFGFYAAMLGIVVFVIDLAWGCCFLDSDDDHEEDEE